MEGDIVGVPLFSHHLLWPARQPVCFGASVEGRVYLPAHRAADRWELEAVGTAKVPLSLGPPLAAT